MVRFLSRSLAIYQYLLIAFLAVGLPVATSMAYTFYERQQQQALSAMNAVVALADIVAANTFRLISDSRETLQLLAARPALQKLDARQCDPVLTHIKEILPRFANLATLDAEGNLVCSAIKQGGDKPVSLATMDVYLETKKSNQFYLGPPHTGPLSGKLVLTMAQPIQTSDHQFNGVIGASLDLAQYQLLPEHMVLPEGVSVVAIAENHLVIARSRNSSEQLGMPFSESSALQGLTNGRVIGRATSNRVQGGGIAVAQVGDTSWRIVATQDDKNFILVQRAQIMWQSFFIFIITLMVIMVIYFLLRFISLPLRQMAHAVSMIAKGDSAARLKTDGPKELAIVAAQFNLALDVRDRAKSALSESEYRWKFAIEGAGDGLWDWDVATGKVFFSKRLKEMFGFSEAEFSDSLSDWERRIHPDDTSRTWAAMRAHLDGTTPNYDSEHRVRCKNGSWKWILDRGLVVNRNADGIALRMIGTHSDVTERVLKNLVLNETFNKISNLQLAIDEHAIVAITNAQGIITHANEKFCQISQYSRAELLGQDHRMINSGHHPKGFMRELWRTITKGDVWKGEIMNRAKDGSYYWVDTTLVPFLNDDGKILQFFAIRRDITEQKSLMLAMRQSADQLRALAAYQSRVKEDERKRIAREIHDDLGGTLTGIQSYLSVLIGRAQRQAAPVDQILMVASTMTNQAIDTVRKLITELRPSVLDQLGIWAALESHAMQVAQRNELVCSCLIEPALEFVELDADASTAAFRIVQELMTNVIRHAEASQIIIRARQCGAWIEIEVEDNGKGIQTNQLATGKSWGIIGMHERAQQCHGDLSIRQAAQVGTLCGTLAVLRLPLGQVDD